jgi:hypothetical protein
MTLSPMEPNVSDNSCHGLEEYSGLQVARECSSVTRENPCFSNYNQASGQDVFGGIQGLFCEADQRSVGNCSQPSHAKYSAEVLKR